MALLTPYWGLDGILVFSSLFFLAYLYVTRKFKYWQKRGIMEIPPLPFVGNFGKCLIMKRQVGLFVEDLYKEAKGLPFMGFYVFDKPFFLARDADLVKNILVKDFNYFSDRYATADVNDRLGYTSLFMIKNPEWKMLRAKLTPIYTSGKLKRMFELMVEVGEDLDRCLESMKLEGNGKDIEMKDFCGNFTTDLIGTTAYGLRVDSMNNPKTAFREHGRMIFSTNFWRGFELLSIFFMPNMVSAMGAKFFNKESTKFLRTVFWDVINQRKESGIKRGDLIDLLLELKQKHENDTSLGNFKFDGDDLVSQAAIFFTGGFETSSTTMSCSLYELALQPEVQQKLRKEILDSIEANGGKITYDMVMAMPYLDMVVAEALRKYPPLGFLERVANADYKIPNSDVVLEKGTPVYISILGLHYDPQYYPNPDKFDPERFSEEQKRSRPSCVYIPFGEGPHMCIGLRLGLLQSKLGLIQVLRKYEVRPCAKTNIPMELDPQMVILAPRGGLHLNVRKITTDAA